MSDKDLQESKNSGVVTDVNSVENQLDPTITTSNLAAAESDPVLLRKMNLINNAIDEIGFTWYHFKLFCLAGFGYSVDSQMEMVQSSVKTYVDYQFGHVYPLATEMFYVALIVGSVFWGFSGDLIGRKIAFNTSLLSSAVFGFFTGGMGSYPTYIIFMFLSTFCAGGNIAMDVAVFLEFLPFKYQYLNTTMAAWWGVGQTIANLIAWAFIPGNSCSGIDDCPSHMNRGWRYTWYTNSGIVLGAGLLRLFVLKMDETPKFLVSVGRDEEAVAVLQKLAAKYNRTCSLTVEQLTECGELSQEYFNGKRDGWSDYKKMARITLRNLKILFQSKIVAWSTSLIWISWIFIGISYSTFYNFLYIYIAGHGGSTGDTNYIVYRNSTLANFVGIFGPILAGALILVPRLGRRGTMTFGALASMAILFGYTTVRTPSGDAGFGSATYFFVNIYYGCLYAYTPEVFPSQARGTGVALALVVCRIAGSLAPVVYFYGAESGSAVPIWVCGALIGCLGFISLLMPFEPSKQRSI